MAWHPAVGFHSEVFAKFRECLRGYIKGGEVWMESLKELNRSLERVTRLPGEIPPFKCKLEIKWVEETRAKAVNVYLTRKASEFIVKDI